MERNLRYSMVVAPSVTLLDQEGYAVGMDGVKTALPGDLVFGIVHIGRPAGEATNVVVGGEYSAIVNGSSTAIAAEDPLTGGPAGKLIKATIGTHKIRCYAREAATADGATIGIFII